MAFFLFIFLCISSSLPAFAKGARRAAARVLNVVWLDSHSIKNVAYHVLIALL